MTTRFGHRQLETAGSGGNPGKFYRGKSADGQNRPRHPPNPDQARREAAVKDDSSNDEGMDGWMDGWMGGWMDGLLHGGHLFFLFFF